jgi:hypothetical protein
MNQVRVSFKQFAIRQWVFGHKQLELHKIWLFMLKRRLRPLSAELLVWVFPGRASVGR